MRFLKNILGSLYFKVEKLDNSPGALAQLDFKKGKITIKFKEDTSDTDATRIENSIVLNLNGNTVSLQGQSNTETPYANAISSANIDRTLGDESLYLKGGEGSMAILELFGPDADNNGVADELETIRNSG
jgi:hypothetical protein